MASADDPKRLAIAVSDELRTRIRVMAAERGMNRSDLAARCMEIGAHILWLPIEHHERLLRVVGNVPMISETTTKLLILLTYDLLIWAEVEPLIDFETGTISKIPQPVLSAHALLRVAMALYGPREPDYECSLRTVLSLKPEEMRLVVALVGEEAMLSGLVPMPGPGSPA
jgi:hypothetical protein